MFERAAVILAAGQSTRMGAVNKLLIEVDGVAMIRTTVGIYASVCDAPVTVVTGHERKAVEAALAGLGVQFVFNPDFEAGQKTSVAAGLRAAPEAEAVFVALGDQPLLRSAHLEWLLAAHNKDARDLITLPTCEETRGNPLVVPRALKPQLLAEKSNPGCQKFTRENPNLVRRVASTEAAFFKDVDTPDDLRNVLGNKELTS